MTTNLKQIRGPNSRTFTLTSDRIIVETKTLRKNDKYEVKLDRLGLDIHYQSDNTMPGKIFLGVCIALVIVSIFGFFLSNENNSKIWIFNGAIWILMGCLAFFKQHQDDIYLVGGQTNLVFYRNIPNEKVVLEFIDKVRGQVKIYLKEKYTTFDIATSEQDFYNRLNWLRDREVISSAEFAEYKAIFDTQKLI
jgi:hypothetical protein